MRHVMYCLNFLPRNVLPRNVLPLLWAWQLSGRSPRVVKSALCIGYGDSARRRHESLSRSAARNSADSS